MEDVVDVGLDGRGADDERGGDLGIRSPAAISLSTSTSRRREVVRERRVVRRGVEHCRHEALLNRRVEVGASGGDARIARSISSALASLVR